MTEELQSSFYDLSIVEEEIRLELNNYEIRKAGPEKFGIRIRTHPYLEITSKLKMGKAIRLWVSYEDKRIQTTRFKRTDKEWLEHNIMVSDKLISKLNERNYNREIYPDQKIWRDVDVSNVISFLQDFNVHEKSHFNKKNVIDYIKKQNERNILISWNVVIRSRKEGELGQISLGGIECNLINRIRSGNKNNKFDVDNPDALIRGLSTVRDEYADLTEKIINQPLSRDENENIRIRDELFKNKGLLVLYPISMNSQPILDPHNKLSLDAEENIIGFSIKFPKIEKDKPVSYMTVDLSDIDREELTNEEYQMIIVD